MKIKRLELDKVYGLLDKKFDLNDGYNFFVGINGSGKTTILKIISKFLEINLAYFEELFFKKIVFVLKNVHDEELEIRITKDDKINVNVNNKKISNDSFWTRELFQELGIVNGFLKLGLSREFLRENEYKVNSLFENKESDLPQEIKEQIINVVNPITQIKSKLKDYGLRNLPEIEKIKFEIKEKKKKEKFDEIRRKYQLLVDKLEEDRPDSKILEEYVNKKNHKLTKNIKISNFEKIISYIAISDQIEKIKEKRDEELEKTNSYNFETNPIEVHENLPKELKDYLKYINNFFCDTNKKLIYDIESGEFYFKYINFADIYKSFISKNFIDFNMLSSGEKELFILITETYLFPEENNIIIIDEPEDSLHVHWQLNLFKELRKMYKEKDTQFIVATHSPEIIESSEIEDCFSLPPLGCETNE